MFKNLELLISDKIIYDLYTLGFLNNLCLHNGLKGLSSLGTYLNIIHNFSEKTNIYINIDWPYAQNDIACHLELIKFYHKKYSCISGFNLCLPFSPIMDEFDITVIKHWKEIISYCKLNNLSVRLFIDDVFQQIPYEREVINEMDSLEFSEIIFFSKRLSLGEHLEVVTPLTKSLSTPKGICNTKIETLEQIKQLNKNFKTVILAPKKFLNILGN